MTNISAIFTLKVGSNKIISSVLYLYDIFLSNYYLTVLMF